MADSTSLRSRRHRGAKLGLRDDELAFYDAVCQNDSAVMELGDDVLKTIAQELVVLSVRTPPSTGTRGSRFERQMRHHIRRSLVKYKYPPDKQ